MDDLRKIALGSLPGDTIDAFLDRFRRDGGSWTIGNVVEPLNDKLSIELGCRFKLT